MAVDRIVDVARRLRRHALELTLLLIADVVLVRLGVVDGPWQVLAACGVAAVVAICVAYSVWNGDIDRGGLHGRAAVQTAALVAITYPTGWGAALAMANLLAVADSVRHSGARAARPVVGWAAAWAVVAQAGVATGLVPSRIDAGASHALAVLAIGVVAVVGRRVERMTDAKEAAEAEAQGAAERFRTLLEASNDVILVISDGIIRAQEPRRTTFGYRAEDVVGQRYIDLLHPDDRTPVSEAVLEMLATDGSTGLIEARFRHPDGHWLPLEFNCRNLTDDPSIRGFVVTARDVSERHHLQAQLEHRAFHDTLTGLANRALLRERLDRVVASAARRPRTFAVLYLDVDDFKSINDSLGHDVGDQILVEVAARLRRVLRSSDTAARLGGDEFAILLDVVASPPDAARVAKRVLHALREPLTVAGRALRLNASVGIVVDETGASSDDLLRNADIAMYMAKREGKGRFAIFEPAMHAEVVERLQTESDLAQALDRGEFVLHYQPVVALSDGHIVGVEALIRWQHPTRGLVPPGDFIPLAESTGHILAIGRWVLREACQQAAAWSAQFPAIPLEMAVNVSMYQLTHGDILEDVVAALDASGLPPDRLVLELTESALAEHSSTVATVLADVRGLGVRIAIDDFGTGYSSLSYLQQFPVDVLKIDRSFVGGLVDGTQHPAVVQAIVDLGHTLELETVAEGIECDDELDRVRALRCQRGQGWLFARPDEGQAVEELLARRVPAPRA